MARSLLAIAVAMAVVGCTPNTDGQSEEGDAQVAVTSESPEPTPTRTPRPTRQPTPEPEPREEPVVVGQGFTPNTEFDVATWAVVLENPNATWVPTFVTVSVTFFDASGTVLTTENNHITAILPESQSAVAGDAFDAADATEMDVQVSRLSESDWLEVDVGEAGRYTYDRVETVRDEFGGMKTTGLILSEFDSEQNNIPVYVVYYDAAGAILGGAFTFVDQVPPHGQAAFEVTTFTTIPNIAETRVFAEVGFT